MFARRFARRLLSCPVCLSRAVRTIDRRDVDDAFDEWLVCCGECGTWRVLVVDERTVRRMERLLSRDRRQIARALGRLERAATGAALLPARTADDRSR